MNGEETTTLGAVAESQANISNPTETAPVAEQPAQPAQPEQTTVADNNWTWTSSWDVEQTTQTLDSFPRIEDLRRSEQDVKINTQVEGTTQVDQKSATQDRVFTRKCDERKVYFKKRFKVITAVYTSVVVLMLSFVIANIAI